MVIITLLMLAGVLVGMFGMFLILTKFGFRAIRLRPNPVHAIVELLIAYISGGIVVFGFENLPPFLGGLYVGIMLQLGSCLYRRHIAQQEGQQDA